MIKPDKLIAIRGAAILSGVNVDELCRLAAYCEERLMGEGTTVFIENMPGESLFLIGKGKIRISRMFAEGDEKTLVVLGSEDIFGEMAVIDGLPRAATARVVETAELISLKKKDFESLCQSDPVLALKLTTNLLREFNKRVRIANDEYRDMLIWSVQEN